MYEVVWLRSAFKQCYKSLRVMLKLIIWTYKTTPRTDAEKTNNKSSSDRLRLNTQELTIDEC